MTNRHHFIPVFYLKNFTNADGHFYIYDVTKQTFKNNGQKFAPSTHFYEHNLNTVYNGNNSSDFIETSLSKNDSEISQIVNKIKDGDACNLTPHEWTYLQFFINILYWRNPARTKNIEQLILKAENLSTFGMSLRNRVTGFRASNEEEKQMMQSPEFKKFLRLKIPGTTYPEIFKKEKNDHAQIGTFPPGLPKLVSDNPIIYMNEEKQSLHTAQFIFPITPTKVLFRYDYDLRPFKTSIRAAIDMLLLAQANNYVSSTDMNYPPNLMEAFQKNFKSIEELKQYIFKTIFSKG